MLYWKICHLCSWPVGGKFVTLLLLKWCLIKENPSAISKIKKKHSLPAVYTGRSSMLKHGIAACISLSPPGQIRFEMKRCKCVSILSYAALQILLLTFLSLSMRVFLILFNEFSPTFPCRTFLVQRNSWMRSMIKMFTQNFSHAQALACINKFLRNIITEVWTSRGQKSALIVA